MRLITARCAALVVFAPAFARATIVALLVAPALLVAGACNITVGTRQVDTDGLPDAAADIDEDIGVVSDAGTGFCDLYAPDCAAGQRCAPGSAGGPVCVDAGPREAGHRCLDGPESDCAAGLVCVQSTAAVACCRALCAGGRICLEGQGTCTEIGRSGAQLVRACIPATDSCSSL